MLTGFSPGDDVRVLDLGPALPENVEFLSGVASRMHFVDALRESLDVGPALRAMKMLGRTHQSAFHLLLLWDCLNYLPGDQGASLVAAVAPLCHPEARCLAMIFTSDTMPAAPTRYRIVDDRRLTYERSTTDLAGAPQMTPAAVEELLAGFSIEHSFVLRNGIREYVATRDLGSQAKDPI
jgi:hypothetical protein